jgi:hypothetical protein
MQLEVAAGDADSNCVFAGLLQFQQTNNSSLCNYVPGSECEGWSQRLSCDSKESDVLSNEQEGS